MQRGQNRYWQVREMKRLGTRRECGGGCGGGGGGDDR